MWRVLERPCMKILRRVVLSVTLCLATGSTAALAGGPSLVYSGYGVSVLSGASAYVVYDAFRGPLQVSRLQRQGKTTHVTLRSAQTAAEAEIQIPTDVAQRARLQVGSVVDSSAVTDGQLLHAGDQVIAFAPNEEGRASAHSRRLTDRP